MAETSPNIPQVETIRAAARRIRDLAEAVPPGPWHTMAKYGAVVATPTATHPEDQGYGGHLIGESMPESVRAHVTTWTPTAALAVAELLESLAEQYEGETEVDDTLECPGCTYSGDCGGHTDTVHDVCGQVVSACACLKPALSVAQAVLGSQAVVSHG